MTDAAMTAEPRFRPIVEPPVRTVPAYRKREQSARQQAVHDALRAYVAKKEQKQ